MDKTSAADRAAKVLQTDGSPASVSQVPPQRISIVGASGSGKSFLAHKLASELGIPLYHLDQLRNQADGQKLSDQAFAEIVAQIVERDAWIIDGHYRAVRQMIWERSSRIVWLDYPLAFVVRRLIGRYRAKVFAPKAKDRGNAGQPKPESASWSTRFSRLLRTLRETRQYAVLLGAQADAGRHVIRVQNPRDADGIADVIRNAAKGGRPEQQNLKGRAPRIIEFLGVPGSGKSTIAGKLTEELQYLDRKSIVNEWKARSAPVKAWCIARSLLDFQMLAASIGIARGARLISRPSLGRLVRVIGKRHWVKTRHGPLLLHQGYLQDIWSILTFNDNEDVDQACVADFLSALYDGTDATLIYLDVDPQTATNRIIGRRDGNSRLDDLAEEQISRLLEKRVWVADLIYSAAVASGLSITKLNGHDEVSHVLNNARQALQQRGFRRPTAGVDQVSFSAN